MSNVLPNNIPMVLKLVDHITPVRKTLAYVPLKMGGSNSIPRITLLFGMGGVFTYLQPCWSPGRSRGSAEPSTELPKLL